MSAPASPRSYAYLASLLAEREVPLPEGIATVEAFIDVLRANTATQDQVSAMIKVALDAPRKAGAPAGRKNNYGAACVLCGIYVQPGEGTIARKASGKGWDTSHTTCPEVPAATVESIAAAPVEAGVYVGPTGDLIRVQAGKKSARLYASIAAWPIREGNAGRKIVWQYLGAAGLALVTADWHLITADEAQAIGLHTHHCMFCGTELSDERDGASIDRGYGPTCARNNGLPWG